MNERDLMPSPLKDAYDLHVHCSPDVVPRSQSFLEVAQAARDAGMAGVGLKDHTTSTVDRCFALNRLFPNGPRFFSSIALNAPVGGLNPAAVEAALANGIDIPWYVENGMEPRPSDPEQLIAAVQRAFDAGADGVLASREYDEMRISSLEAFGKGVSYFPDNPDRASRGRQSGTGRFCSASRQHPVGVRPGSIPE